MTKVDSIPSERIKIVCRIRPLLAHESEQIVVHVNDPNSITLENKKDPTKQFVYSNFSSCYPPSATQDEIFVQDVKPLIGRVFEGYDATIFAYGVTGSGKTFTMEGRKQEPGIIPKVVDFLFRKKQVDRYTCIVITMSYMQILKDAVYDMLVPKHKNRALDIREDSERNVFVANLVEKQIDTNDDFLKIYSMANKNRSTASTKLNSTSSRSHAILTLNVKSSSRVLLNNGQQQNETVMGKINLIDLAGSEDNRKSGNEKMRMAESSAINKSLFVLGQVIEALNNGSIRAPFRDSKITRILQPTLGGNALAMMIINLAPGYSLINDTTNTLNFANRTRELRNTPKADIRRSKPSVVPISHKSAIVPSSTRTVRQILRPNRPSIQKEAAHQSIHHNINRRTTSMPPHKRRLSMTTLAMPTLKKPRSSPLPPNSPANYTCSSPSWTYNSPPCHSQTATMSHYRTIPSSPSILNLERRLRGTLSMEHGRIDRDTISSSPTSSQRRTEFESLANNALAEPLLNNSMGHDSMETEEETVTMTRTELEQLRKQWINQGKQELLSSLYGSTS